MSWQADQKWLRYRIQRSVERREQQLLAAGFVRVPIGEIPLRDALRDLGALRREATKCLGTDVHHEYWTKPEAINQAVVLLKTSDDWSDRTCGERVLSDRCDRRWSCSFQFTNFTNPDVIIPRDIEVVRVPRMLAKKGEAAPAKIVDGSVVDDGVSE